MNVGQILETHLGWAGYLLGTQLQEMLEKKTERGELRERILKPSSRAATSSTSARGKLPDAEVAEMAKSWKHGLQLATPVFDGASEDEIKAAPPARRAFDNGQTVLFDGRTGEAFHEDVTVGIMYMLKLHHLVDDKIHARSIGPYSLVTQQPLGGKAQFGGQRLG